MTASVGSVDGSGDGDLGGPGIQGIDIGDGRFGVDYDFLFTPPAA